MNRETWDEIKMHMGWQVGTHSAGYLLSKADPQMGKLYRDNWWLIHMVLAAVTFLAVLAERGTVKHGLPTAQGGGSPLGANSVCAYGVHGNWA